nr:uncharacterized protein LOC104107998 [Nicotiana tomentosiformis]
MVRRSGVASATVRPQKRKGRRSGLLIAEASLQKRDGDCESEGRPPLANHRSGWFLVSTRPQKRLSESQSVNINVARETAGDRLINKTYRRISNMAGARKEIVMNEGNYMMSRRSRIWATNSKERASEGDNSVGISSLFVFYFLHRWPFSVLPENNPSPLSE